MISIKEAENIIRKDKTIGCIWFGFYYNNEVGFVVSPHDKYIPGDTEGYNVLINERGDIRKVKFLPSPITSEKVFIDMDESDFGKIV